MAVVFVKCVRGINREVSETEVFVRDYYNRQRLLKQSVSGYLELPA
jgi:hypothetical protein